MHSAVHHLAGRAIEVANGVLQSGNGPKKIDIPPLPAFILSLTIVLLAGFIFAVSPLLPHLKPILT